MFLHTNFVIVFYMMTYYWVVVQEPKYDILPVSSNAPDWLLVDAYVMVCSYIISVFDDINHESSMFYVAPRKKFPSGILFPEFWNDDPSIIIKSYACWEFGISFLGHYTKRAWLQAWLIITRTPQDKNKAFLCSSYYKVFVSWYTGTVHW